VRGPRFSGIGEVWEVRFAHPLISNSKQYSEDFWGFPLNEYTRIRLLLSELKFRRQSVEVIMRSKCLLPWDLRGIRPAAIVGLLAFGISLSVATAGDQVELGRQLFEHKWVPNDSLSPDGDGLGPLYNADSCVACHHLGATGGAGSTSTISRS
jgi:hypothetical protein